MDDLERLNALDELMAHIYEVVVSAESDSDKLATIKAMLLEQVKAEHEFLLISDWLEPVEQVFISIPLVDGSLYAIFPSQVKEWAEAYPAVDIEQELRKMVQWSKANPRKRKTRRGIGQHIVGWLGGVQDKGGSGNARHSGDKAGLFERFLKDGR